MVVCLIVYIGIGGVTRSGMIIKTQQDGMCLLQTTSQISKMIKFAASKQLRCEAISGNAFVLQLLLASYCYYDCCYYWYCHHGYCGYWDFWYILVLSAIDSVCT